MYNSIQYLLSADSHDVIKASRPRAFPTTQPTYDEHEGRSILHRIGTVTAAPDRASDSEEASNSVESEEESEWTKRSKVPRMRMYADEEEVRIERRKAQVQAQSRRKKERDVRNSHEKVPRYEDQERRRRSSSSAHEESSRSNSRNKDSKHRKSRTLESFDKDTTSKTQDDLRSRLDRDGKNKARGGASVVTSTVWDRLNHHQSGDTVDWEQESSGSDLDVSDLQDNDHGSYADLRGSLLQGKKNSSKFGGGDLRSKLNLKKTMRHHTPMQKSPLRIEIDNDEYYRLIGSDQE